MNQDKLLTVLRSECKRIECLCRFRFGDVSIKGLDKLCHLARDSMWRHESTIPGSNRHHAISPGITTSRNAAFNVDIGAQDLVCLEDEVLGQKLVVDCHCSRDMAEGKGMLDHLSPRADDVLHVDFGVRSHQRFEPGLVSRGSRKIL